VTIITTRAMLAGRGGRGGGKNRRDRLFQFRREGLGRGASWIPAEGPTFSAKASENRGCAREPATWIYVPHKFMRLRGPFFRSRIPFANLPQLPLRPRAPASSLLALFLSPATLCPPRSFRPGGRGRIPAFRGFFPRPPSRLRSVCYLLSREISRSICYRAGRGWVRRFLSVARGFARN